MDEDTIDAVMVELESVADSLTEHAVGSVTHGIGLDAKAVCLDWWEHRRRQGAEAVK